MKKSNLVLGMIDLPLAILIPVCLGLTLIAIPFVNAHASGNAVFLVKTGDIIEGKTLDVISGYDTYSNLSFNNLGEIVFLGWWDADNDGFPEKRGIFTQDALIFEPPVQLGGHNVVQISFPSINDSGEIAFFAYWDDDKPPDGFADGRGIFNQEKGLLFEDGWSIEGEKIIDLSSFDQPVINNSGEVAFMGEIDADPWFPASVVTQNRLLVQEGDIIDGSEVRVLSDPYKWRHYNFNNTGELAFLATLPGEFPAPSAVFTTQKLLFKEGEVLNGSNTIYRLGVPVINDDEEVAVFGDFQEYLGDGAVLTQAGVLVKGGDVIEGRVLDRIRNVSSINNPGEVLFQADYLIGGEKYRGWFTQDRFIIDVSAMVEGKSVYLLGDAQINDSGDVVLSGFWLSDGIESSGIVLVTRNSPPVADAGPDQTVAAGANCEVSVLLDGSSSTDPDSAPGTNNDIISFEWYEGQTPLGSGETINYWFVPGQHAVTLLVTDSYGETDSDEVVITVQDTIPPEISLSVSPDTLWPPNHKMALITRTIITNDNCDLSPVIELSSIAMNEEDEIETHDSRFDSTVGDGHTTEDVQIDEDGNVFLRAERAGTGSGRIYTIIYVATDASGNAATANATVIVPLNQ